MIKWYKWEIVSLDAVKEMRLKIQVQEFPDFIPPILKCKYCGVHNIKENEFDLVLILGGSYHQRDQCAFLRLLRNRRGKSRQRTGSEKRKVMGVFTF
jgi:hypothetical protein